MEWMPIDGSLNLTIPDLSNLWWGRKGAMFWMVTRSLDLTVPDLSYFRWLWSGGKTPFWTWLPLTWFFVRFARRFPGTLVAGRWNIFELGWTTDFGTRFPFAWLIGLFARRLPLTFVANRFRRKAFFGTRSVIARRFAGWFPPTFITDWTLSFIGAGGGGRKFLVGVTIIRDDGSWVRF
jgi:hypothetical protein